MKIKALTLWQPWASLVATGAKRNETRSWATRHRGLLAIHAAKRKPTADDIIHSYRRMTAALALSGQHPFYGLPFGAVLCVVRLVGIDRTEAVLAQNDDSFSETDEYHFGDYSPGRFAWKLEMVHRFPEPIPAAGHQGLWYWNWEREENKEDE